MKSNQAVFLLILFFVLSVVIRLPHLDRPLSKHHEFNPAVILMGLESWKEAGGPEKFNYIPLLTYQNAADRLLQKGPYIDREGNQIYLSFGPGWYVIPYVVFDAFGIPFKPLALQILNLFFLLTSAWLLFRLGRYLFAKAGIQSYIPSIAACFVYLFSPAILWFMGNGYVCTGIVMPFLILITHYGTRMLYDLPQVRVSNLLLYFLAGIAGIYIDWFAVSFLGMISLFALLRVRKQQRGWIVLLISGLTIVTGILLIFFQFVSYAGWDAVYDYWTSRYGDRGIANPKVNSGLYVIKILKHLVTGFLPILIVILVTRLLAWGRIDRGKIQQPVGLALKIALFSCLAHAAIFLNWSGAHDFALIPVSIVLALYAGWISVSLSRKQLLLLGVGTLAMSVVQYYAINYPGKHNFKGFPYDAYKKTGEIIQKTASNDERIFCNDPYMIYQFYAKRNFTIVGNYEDALKWAASHGVQKGVWIKLHEDKDRVVIDEVKHFSN